MTHATEDEDGPDSLYLHDLDGRLCHYPDGSKIPLSHFEDELSEEEEARMQVHTVADRIADIEMLGQPVPQHLLDALECE